jgi:hypothetical protein
MNRFVVIFAAAAICAGVNSAWAADGDEEVVTSSRPATSPNTVLSATAAASTPTATDSVQTLKLQDDSSVPAYDATNPLRPHMDLSLIHGSAGVTIGTGGYRSVYATAVMPVANDGVLGIAVKQTDFGKNGGLYDYGYGYGGYGYGRGYRQRGGKQTSVAVALDMGDGQSSTAPAGCAPGFRDGDGRYVEPVWVTQLHDHRKCDVTETSTQGQ